MVYLLDLLIVQIIWRLSYEVGVPTIHPAATFGDMVKAWFSNYIAFQVPCGAIKDVRPWNELCFIQSLTLPVDHNHTYQFRAAAMLYPCILDVPCSNIIRLTGYCVSVLRGFPKCMQDSTVKYATIASLKIRIYASFIHKLNLQGTRVYKTPAVAAVSLNNIWT
jgi:hypothetical protein